MTTQRTVYCPLCEADTGIPATEVQSPTIPPFMPDRVTLVSLLRHLGHECDPRDRQAVQAADLAKGLSGG